MSSLPLPPDSPERDARKAFSAKQLAAAIRAQDGAAFFVEPRVLRRVIKLDRDINTLGLQVPHAGCYVIARSLLSEFVEPDELIPTDALPERVILLPLPEADELAQYAPAELMARYGRLLFHARVHFALEQRLAAGGLGATALRQRICRLGQTEFEEARAVLRMDDLLLPPRDDLQVYIELAAVFLELDRFAPERTAWFFPAIRDRQAMAALFLQDVADDEHLAALRRTGPSPLSPAEGNPLTQAAQSTTAAIPSSVDRSVAASESRLAGPDMAPSSQVTGPTHCPEAGRPGSGGPLAGTSPRERRLLDRARRAEEVGNVVLGAILRVRAERAAAKSVSAPARVIDEDSRYDLSLLVSRLRTAIGFEDARRAAWEHSLRLLLRRCADDRLTVEGRLLYDLQKVCVDHERELFTVDLTEWLLSWGRRPIRRPLPALKEVLACKHLRTALRRSRDVELPEADRSRLAELLRQALHHAQDAARERLRPGIAQALRSVGLVPANVPEEVARHKVVEELLDKAVESGYLRFGDLRDAISRNNLRLPDLASVDTFGAVARQASDRTATAGRWSWLLFPVVYVWLWLKHLLFGDHLLRADRALAVPLDGVYHRAEVYLRLFQRITSLGFGIGAGRLLNRFFVLPLLGAFLVVSFYQEMAHLTKLDHLVPSGNVIEAVGDVFRDGWRGATAEHPVSLTWLTGLGLFFLGLINSAAVRRWTARAWKHLTQAVATLVRALIRWLAQPVIQAVLYNPWIVLARRYLLKPAAFTLLTWLLLFITFERHPTPVVLGGLFVGLNFLLNSRVGRNVEEITNDWLAKTWSNVRTRVASGVYWLIVDLSKAFLEAVDRLLYAVDEWLRFRRGESRWSFLAKAILGAVWSAVTYVVRFAINLLLEPQINPIKHFPVVTVSHKVLLPMTVSVEWNTVPSPLGLVLVKLFGLEAGLANSIAFAVVWGIPGIFGFLAWELKENWKLYAANRPTNLRPVRIGHHGETMARLLCPGVHSGTVPKLFRKIRRAIRKADGARERAEDWQKPGFPEKPGFFPRKPLDQLGHVRHALARYVERELFYLLEQCPPWRREMTLGAIDLATNRIRLELRSGPSAEDPCWLTFEQQGGWLLADLEPGWAARLPDAERAMFRDALLGLYKTSGVELVRPHLAGLWPGQAACYRVAADDRLVVWPTDPHAPEVSYRLDEEGPIEPVSTGEVPAAFQPLAASDSLLFSSRPLPWVVWVEAWDRHAQGASGPPLLRSVRLLPVDAVH